MNCSGNKQTYLSYLYHKYLWSIDVSIIHIFLKCSKHVWSSLLFKFLSDLRLKKQSKGQYIESLYIIFYS